MQKTTYPMHSAQRDIYVDQLINKESPLYNIGGYIKLKGILDLKKFHEAVNSASAVFDAFKMRFDFGSEKPEIFIDEDYCKAELKDIDFSKNKDPKAEALDWMQNRFNTHFIVKKENPLYEQSLLKISESEYWFFGRYHHLITDGYGFIVFVQYFAQKYKALISGEEKEFIYPNYLDVIEESNKYPETPAYEADKKYWTEKISEKPNSVINRKYLQKDNSGFNSTSFIYDLNEKQKEHLEKIQLETKAGLQQLTIAALMIYFGKTSGQTELLIGVPVHKRGSKVLRSIVGMFSGILPFKGNFRRDIKLSELLKEISQIQKNDYRHQNFPLSEINRNLKDRSAQEYLYEVSVNYEPLNFELDYGPEIEADIIRLESDSEKNPLQIFWRDYGNNKPLQLKLITGNEYFNDEETELFKESLLFIIDQFPENLDAEIRKINIIPKKEMLLLDKFNDTSVEFPGAKNLVEIFQKQAAETPENIALIFKDKKITFEELNTNSNKLANYLRSKGVKEETLVPVCIERSIDMITGILGILKAGAAYVPLNIQYPEERISYLLEDTNAGIILSSKESSVKIPVSDKYEIILTDENLSDINKHSDENLKSVPSAGNLAYVIYTSGSTGKPKGVLIEHQTVVNLINAQSRYFNVNSNDKILQFSNYSFDASVEQMFLAMLNGATLVLIPDDLLLSGEEFENYLNKNNVTHLHATPSFLENLNPDNFKYLKRIIAGGDICKKELSDKWKNNASFYNEYGPTETTVTSIEYNDIGKNEFNISLPIGKPLSNIRINIVNSENEICPIGIAGELFISGDCLARGYLNKPEITSEKFSKDLFSDNPESRMYRTGDIGRWMTDGNIEYLGRIDEQVKIRGYRIELGEIESVINEFEQVSNSSVVAISDYSGNKRLVAYVILKGEFDKVKIQDFLKMKLPEYMIPDVFVEMESFPVSSNGKVDRKAFPVPDAEELVTTEYVAPVTELEQKLSELWREILKTDKIGINDNFFELGGHSLNAIQLTTAIHKQLNIKTDIGMIFSNPTISKLSRQLSEKKLHQFTEIKKLPEAEFYELSHSQKRFWILSNFRDGSAAYNVAGVFTIEGNLNINAFKKAFDSVFDRHEILRTVFSETEGNPYQKILPLENMRFRLNENDLRNEVNKKQFLKNKIEEDARLPFDLKNGPLVRATLFKEDEDKHLLLFNIHHIISDGWSKGIFVNEFLYFYNIYCENGKNSLTPLPVQYKDYAAWHNSSFALQAKYWSELYENGIPVLTFPADFERPKVLTYFGEMIKGNVSEDVTLKLQNMAVQNNMSLNNLLMALYGLLVATYSGQEELVLGSVSSGRSHPDLENLIGVFINFLPVKLSPKKHLKLSEYLTECQNEIVQAYSNQDYPFDMMVDEIVKKRDISRNPFFDTMINFQLDSDFSGNNKTGGISIEPDESMQENLFQSVLDFKLDVVPQEGKLKLFLSYNSKLFLEQRMSGFLSEFNELLYKVVTEPEGYLTQYKKWEDEKSEMNIVENKTEQETPALPVNICASFVAEPVLEFMEYWGKEMELNFKVNFAPYNQVFQQLLNPGSLLYGNKGLNILLIRILDWLRDHKEMSVNDQISFLNKNYSELTHILTNIREKIFIPFVAGIVPVYSETGFSKEVIAHINKLNKDLELFIADQPSFQLIDFDKIADLYEITEIYDVKSDELGHMPFTPEFYAVLGTYITRKVNAFMSPAYKVIALDCDNTLWKGICGELGAENVYIDKNFIELQEFFIEKYKEGFLLVLCSKNNESDVWEVFDRHPEMRLKREFIAAHRINWNPKSENLISISKELNLGINSFIFIDDNEFETEQMSLNCPEVLSLQLPEEDDTLLSFLNHIWAFDYFRITDEDRKRNEMYKVEKQRKEEESKHGSLDDFLKSLEIKVDIRPITQNEMERAVQLTLRTNQFNLNGIRKTPEEVAEFIKDDKSLARIIEVKDRFGDYGIVGVVLAKLIESKLEIETFLLSCRVLGRNVEMIILEELKEYCIQNKLDVITALYKETPKNKPFAEFLSKSEWNVDPETNVHSQNLKTAEQIVSK